jgi:hypothetical protein
MALSICFFYDVTVLVGRIRIVAVSAAARNNNNPLATNVPLNPMEAFIAPAATAIMPPAKVPAKFRKPNAVARKFGGIPSHKTGMVLPSYIPFPNPNTSIAP